MIEIFGDTVTSSSQHPEQPPTFSDLIFDRYGSKNRDENYRGVNNCSEERILYFLKKISNKGVVVIFHGNNRSEFCPGSSEDFVDLPSHEVSFYNDIRERIPFNTSSYHNLPPEQMSEMLVKHRRLFYNKDLLSYRYQGALAMIDGYLSAKRMQVIHCINPVNLPAGFCFKSGVVDKRPFDIMEANPDLTSANGISETGNHLIAKILFERIDDLKA